MAVLLWGLIFEEEAAQNQMRSPSSNCEGPEASKESGKKCIVSGAAGTEMEKAVESYSLL